MKPIPPPAPMITIEVIDEISLTELVRMFEKHDFKLSLAGSRRLTARREEKTKVTKAELEQIK